MFDLKLDKEFRNPTYKAFKIPANIQYFDITSFCQFVGVSEDDVKRIANNTSVEYKTFYINKDTNKIVSFNPNLRLRKIDAPSEKLKRIQLGLGALFKALPYNDVNFGFIEGKHMRDAAEQVSKGQALIHADAKDFFPGHAAWFVAGKLEELLQDKFTGVFDKEFISLITKLVTLNGQLPQGSPCSPILTVVLNKDMDDKIKALSDANELVYVRYVDDLVFSGEISNRDALNFLDKLGELIHPHRLNWKKCGIMRHSAKPICRGFSITTNKVLQSNLQVKLIGKIKDLLKEYSDVKMVSSMKSITVTCKIDNLDVYKTISDRLLDYLKDKYPSYDWFIKRNFYYIQSVKTVLGMHVNDGKVNYPRKEYNKLRLEAMLMGIQRALQKIKFINDNLNNNSLKFILTVMAESVRIQGKEYRNLLDSPMNRKAFNGKVAYIQSITPKQGEQLKAIEEKFFKRQLRAIVSKFSACASSGDAAALMNVIRRDLA